MRSLRIGGRQRIFRRAGRTDRGAAAAAGADIWIDCDVIAGGRDGAGRADVEAAGAADDTRARMRAELGVEIDEARLVELADEMACRKQDALDRRWIARIGVQITASQVIRGEKRRAAGEVEDQITMGCGAVACRTENQPRS